MAGLDHFAPELGVLGTGRMGSRLAAMFARAGRKVVLGSRDSDRAAEIVRKLDIPTLRAGCYSDAVRASSILPAVFMTAVIPAGTWIVASQLWRIPGESCVGIQLRFSIAWPWLNR